MVGRTAKAPITLPGGEIMPYMSARRRHEIMDVAFQMCGGVERLVHEMNRNTEGYWAGVNLWGKGLPRAVATDHSINTKSVEDLWDKLDAREADKKAVSAPIIEGSFTDVPVED